MPDLDKMSDVEYRVYENRVRRMAQRQRLSVQKSRRRDPRAWDYGTFMLVDPDRNTCVACSAAGAYGMSLDEVERWLLS